MTLTRLFIIVLILLALTGGGAAWLWEYAYTPQGRAKTIFTQLRGDTTSLRGWMIQHGVIKREILSEEEELNIKRADAEFHITDDLIRGWFLQMMLDRIAAHRLAAIGPDALPVLIAALKDPDGRVREVAFMACMLMNDSRGLDQAVAEIGSTKAISYLRELSTYDDNLIRRPAANALKAALHDPDSKVRQAAADALKRFNPEETITQPATAPTDK